MYTGLRAAVYKGTWVSPFADVICKARGCVHSEFLYKRPSSCPGIRARLTRLLLARSSPFRKSVEEGLLALLCKKHRGAVLSLVSPFFARRLTDFLALLCPGPSASHAHISLECGPGTHRRPVRYADDGTLTDISPDEPSILGRSRLWNLDGRGMPD